MKKHIRIEKIIKRYFFQAPIYVARLAWHGKKTLRLARRLRKFPEDAQARIKAKANYLEAYALVQEIARKINLAGSIEVEAIGLENLPKEDGFMFFPNHQGLYDVIAIVDTCPRPFSFVIKQEAARIILLKQVVEALGAHPIDREDLRQSLKVIQKVGKEVQGGKNFLIFAEGTRSKKGNVPLEFKGGSFKSAMSARCPIVPCALIDAFKPFDQGSIEPVKVRLVYLPPLYFEEYGHMSSKELADTVRGRIVKAIEKHG